MVTTPDSRLIEGFTYRAPVFTDDPFTPGTAVKAAHLTEIRVALRQAYDACQQLAPDYTRATLVPGTTRIKAIHLAELRAAIVALE